MSQKLLLVFVLALAQQSFGANLGPAPAWDVAGCIRLLNEAASSTAAASSRLEDGQSVTALFPRLECKSKFT